MSNKEKKNEMSDSKIVLSRWRSMCERIWLGKETIKESGNKKGKNK